jgi:hypothetical protein
MSVTAVDLKLTQSLSTAQILTAGNPTLIVVDALSLGLEESIAWTLHAEQWKDRESELGRNYNQPGIVVCWNRTISRTDVRRIRNAGAVFSPFPPDDYIKLLNNATSQKDKDEIVDRLMRRNVTREEIFTTMEDSLVDNITEMNAAAGIIITLASNHVEELARLYKSLPAPAQARLAQKVRTKLMPEQSRKILRE